MTTKTISNHKKDKPIAMNFFDNAKKNIVTAGVKSKIRGFAREAGCTPKDIRAIIISSNDSADFEIHLYVHNPTGNDKFVRKIALEELF